MSNTGLELLLRPKIFARLQHWENYISISFHSEWYMIVVTFFLSILNQMEFHMVQNRKENCHHDDIPFNVKGNSNIVFSVQNGKPTPIRRAAVREAGVSRHHGGPIEGAPPLKLPKYHSTIVLRGLREPSIRPTSCRETLVSRSNSQLLHFRRRCNSKLLHSKKRPGPVPSKIYKSPIHLRSGANFRKYAEWAESNEKSYFRFLFFELWWKFIKKLTILSTKMTISQKLKIEKI